MSDERLNCLVTGVAATERLPLTLVYVLAIVAFLCSFAFPDGAASSLLYALVLLASFAMPLRHYDIFMLAGVCTLLGLVAHAVSVDRTISPTALVANEVLATLVVWGIAIGRSTTLETHDHQLASSKSSEALLSRAVSAHQQLEASSEDVSRLSVKIHEISQGAVAGAAVMSFIAQLIEETRRIESSLAATKGELQEQLQQIGEQLNFRGTSPFTTRSFDDESYANASREDTDAGRLIPLSKSSRIASNLRYPYRCKQPIASYSGGVTPAPQDFQLVQCVDISTDGFSFLASSTPKTQLLVVGLGSPPALVFVTAEVESVAIVAPEDSDLFHVVCQFRGRLVSPDHSILSQTLRFDPEAGPSNNLPLHLNPVAT